VSRRALLWAGAIAFFLWEIYAATHWIIEGRGLANAASLTWDRVRHDWFLLILVTDHAVIAGTALVWILIDARRLRGWSMAECVAYAIAYIALGSPALLGYLAERRPGVLPREAA
jgi:hypothetical protein